jgi:hypothetical protein
MNTARHQKFKERSRRSSVRGRDAMSASLVISDENEASNRRDAGIPIPIPIPIPMYIGVGIGTARFGAR